MIKNSILKAEVLISRRCNLFCQYCKITKTIPIEQELTTKQWSEAFNIIYKNLGASFIAIYGGEPLCLGKKKLCEIVNMLSKYRPEKSFTIISNCIGLTDGYIKELIDNGLDSWTASVDTLNPSEEIDGFTASKSRVGLTTLLKMKKMGLRDVCGIITATRKNIKHIPDTVKYLSDNGAWAGIDCLHFRKCEGQSGLPEKESMKELIFRREDISQISIVSDKLIEMKRKGALIFPTYEVLEGWKDVNNFIDLNWKCGTKFPYCITVDSDGKLMECDSFQGSRIKKYSIFDLPKKWSEFSNDYMEDVSMECLGCYWSTHFCAKDIIENYKTKYYQHETEN